MVREVTDPKILAQLEGDTATEVTDPEILRQLESDKLGFKGIGEDISSSISGLPQAAFDLLKSIPGMAKGAVQYAGEHPFYETLGQAGLGIGEGAASLLSAPQSAFRYLGGKFAPESALTRGLKQTPTPFELLKEGEEAAGISQDEKAQSVRALSEMILGAKGLSKLGGAGKRAGAIGTEQGGRGENPLQASLLSLAGEGVASGARKVPELRPSKMIKSPLSAEELEKALNVTKDTETGLGEVIENPFLQQQYQNVLSKIPFSGVNQAMQRTAGTVLKQGTDLLDNFLGKNPIADTGSEILNALKEAKKSITKQKNEEIFKPVNELAEKHNVQTERPQLRSEATKILNQIESDPDLALFRSEADKNLLKKLAKIDTPEVKESVIVSSGGNPIEIPIDKNKFSIKESEFLKSELGERAQEAYSQVDKPKGNAYTRLKKAIESDIDNAIENSGVDELKNKRKEALKWYKENFAPFEEPEIVKFTNRGGDPDTIANYFLRTSRLSDRANLLNKLQEKLPQSKKHLLPYSYFSQAMEEGELNPLKLRTLYKKLGNRQKEALIPDKKIRNQFENYNTLVQKNTEPLNIMFNPKTGARLGSEIPYATSTLTTALGSLLTGSIPGGLAASALPMAASRVLTKYLTSPKQREKLITKMIEQKKKGEKPDSKYLRSLLAELTRVEQTGEEQ